MNSPNFDNLLLQTLMNKLQIRPPTPLQSQLTPNLDQTLKHLLLNTINNLPDSDRDQDEDFNTGSIKSRLSVEELKLEKEVIKIILSGNGEENLKPNSGQAVAIGEHYICVGYYSDPGSEYRVWEWHGHVMLFDEENGYDPEYIYGNYFEKLSGLKMKKDDQEEKVVNFGLKELIGWNEESGSGRVLRRSLNVGCSPSV